MLNGDQFIQYKTLDYSNSFNDYRCIPLRGQCSDWCNEKFLATMGGKSFTKAVKNMWETKDRKYCRHCRYGVVIENNHCVCCGRLFAVVPRNAKSKRKLVIDFIRY